MGYLGGITYTLDDVNHTATITGCTENTFGTLIIPATLMNGTYTVTAIANNAFNGNGNISSVSIPASVTTIGNSAFSNCQSHTAFTVDASNASYKSDNGIIYSKDGEQLVAYPVGKTETSFTIPASVESITNYAFEGNKHLTTIQLSAAFNLISHVPSAFYGIDNHTPWLCSQPDTNTAEAIGMPSFGEKAMSFSCLLQAAVRHLTHLISKLLAMTRTVVNIIIAAKRTSTTIAMQQYGTTMNKSFSTRPIQTQTTSLLTMATSMCSDLNLTT